MSLLAKTLRVVGNSNFSSQNYNLGSNTGLPMLNEITSTLTNFFYSQNQMLQKKTLIKWYKLQPELTAIVNKVARDIVGDYHFEPVNPNESGRNKVLKANRFAQEVQYRRSKFSQIVDALVTGEGYAWVGKLSIKDVEDSIKSVMQRYSLTETKQFCNKLLNEIKVEKGIINVNGIDEDVLKPRKYRYIASSSMEIVYDLYDTLGYKQRVGGREEMFTTDDIIRTTLMDVDGKVPGFAPVGSLLVQLELLRSMWDNMTSIQRNGGAPDKIIVAEDIRPTDPAYLKLKNQLQQYKLVQNKHGHLLFTGKIHVEELQQLENMQFKDMGLYIQSIIAQQWQLPRSSYAPIIGDSNSKDDTGGNAEKSYWENIEYSQQIIADIDNLQLWIPHFGVKLVFDRKYTQKDVQIETAKQLKFNNVKLVNEIMQENKKRITFESKAKLLDIPVEMFEDIPKDELIMPDVKSTLNAQLPLSKVNDSQDKSNLRDKKKSEQQSTQGSIQKPTGTGKEKNFNKYPYTLI